MSNIRIPSVWCWILALFFLVGAIGNIDVLFNYEDPFPNVAKTRRAIRFSPTIVFLVNLLLLFTHAYLVLAFLKARSSSIDIDVFLKLKVILFAYLLIFAVVSLRDIVVSALWESVYENYQPATALEYLYIFGGIFLIAIFLLKAKRFLVS